MMKATDQLKKDHESVIRMLGILSSVKHRLAGGAPVPAADMADMLDFLRVYVDRYHHGKEENLLFPRLVEIGIPNERGPVGVMLSEHVQGREYISGFAGGIEMYRNGETGGAERIISSLSGYCELLDSHIHKENDILFMMADMHLSTDDQETLSARFAELELEVLGEVKPAEYLRLLERLSNIYL